MLRSLVIAVVLVSSHVALAGPIVVATESSSPMEIHPQDDGRTVDLRPKQHGLLAKRLAVPIMLIENSMVMLPPLYYYWNTVDQQKEDWELKWTWEDWKDKLFSTKDLVLDTNRFEPNGFRHELAGAMTYQIGRANGLGPVGSLLLDFAGSLVWEYVVEYREFPSVNDIFSNTMAGIMVGEPLFQIGLLADGHPSLARSALGLIASPFHRVQKEIGLSPLADSPAMPNRLDATLITNLVKFGDERPDAEVGFGFDLEVVRDRDFGQPGKDATWRSLAWNQAAVDVRFAAEDGALSGVTFHSFTSLYGRHGRTIDDDGYGRSTFAGLVSNFELLQRRSTNAIDRYASFDVLNPRFGGWWRTPYGQFDLDLGVAGDVAMVQALSRLDLPLDPEASVVLARGYYYGTGVGAHGRFRAFWGKWHAELETTARQFWSYDNHSYRGTDPQNLWDRRWITTARIGYRPTASELRLELTGGFALRRGGGEDQMTRSFDERDLGLVLRAGF